MGIAEEIEEEQDAAELRVTARRLQRQLAQAKAKSADLVQAVYQAAHDASVVIGSPPAVSPPVRDKRRGKAEVAILHASDWQVGKVTESFNSEVATERVELLGNKVEKLTAIQRADHPVKRCHLFLGGDMVEGVSIFPGQAWEVDSTLYDQLFHTVDLMHRLVRKMASVFYEVQVDCEDGNHGRIGKKGEFPGGDNIDRIAYRILADRLVGEKRIRIVQPKSWYQLPEVGNVHPLLIHGDEIKFFGGNCVTPEVRVLTRDLRWVPAGELKVGQQLLAFDEKPTHLHGKSQCRHYRNAEVVGTGRKLREVYELTFADGSTVRSTPEHQWVVSLTDRKSGGSRRQIWMETKDISDRLNLPYKGKHGSNAGRVWMARPIEAWDDGQDDYISGLLAGAFDADGSYGRGIAKRWPILEFAQYDNALLAAVEQALTAKGFEYKKRLKYTPQRKEIWCLDLCPGRKDETLRFLGQLRPARLLTKWMNDVPVETLTFTHKSYGIFEIVKAELISTPQEVVTLTTDSETYITEHGASHNTPLFGIIKKFNNWASGVIPYFQDGWVGHFHTPATPVMARGTFIRMNGTLESDSNYAREFMAATGRPAQRLCFAEPEKGRVTADYVLYLDGEK